MVSPSGGVSGQIAVLWDAGGRSARFPVQQERDLLLSLLRQTPVHCAQHTVFATTVEEI